MRMRHLTRSIVPLLLTTAALFLVILPVRVGTNGPKFYSDDPLLREPETQDAAGAQEWEIDLAYDLMLNLFARPGDSRDIRALNVNTIDEVPDSSWFTNRILTAQLSLEELTRGPNTMDGPAPGRWTIVGAKTAGAAPGFTVRDERGELWFVSFDGKGHPEAATGAIVVATKLFWALGYNQVENYLTRMRAEDLVIGEGASVTPLSGKRRPMRMGDVERVLDRAHRSPDGSYRAIAGRGLQGKPLGGFKYYGTRPDDPNDIVPHEHRRELRALHVFGAWTNLVDMKAGNTLDMLVTEGNRSIVRHYLQDVGSTFGTGALGPREWEEGYEYLYEGDKTFKRLVTLGFYLQPWQTVPYEDHDAIGRFDGDYFDPERWRSRVPAMAVLRARDDDTFWAARRVMAFTDEAIRAIVKTGQYSDPAAEKHLADVLIKRRDRIGQVYFRKVTPLVGFALDADGTLRFQNAAVQTGFARAPAGGYSAQWATYDNTTGEARPLASPATAQAESLKAPGELANRTEEFVKASIRAVETPESGAPPVDVYFRRTGGTWKLVGVQRLPDETPEGGAPGTTK
jgi:hypothetical protein